MQSVRRGHSQEMNNKRERTQLYVYDGEGASEMGVSMAIHSLRQCIKDTQYEVSLITPQEIKTGRWVESAALLVIGGGYDLGFLRALGPDGAAQVKEYVQSGGSYLGLCAGAYFASAWVTFDKGGDLEVCGPRPLGFFPGACVGPTLPGFQYNKDSGVYAASIAWTLNNQLTKHSEDTTQRSDSSYSDNFHCYFNGGGHFTDPTGERQQSCYEVIGRYKDLDSRPVAAVKCCVGQGMAVLSGVHLEYDPFLLSDDSPRLKSLLPILRRSDGQRQRCLRQVLQMLGIKVAITNCVADAENCDLC